MKYKDTMNHFDKRQFRASYRRGKLDDLKTRIKIVNVLTVIFGAIIGLASLIPFFIAKTFLLFTNMGDYDFLVTTQVLLSLVYLVGVVIIVYLLRQYVFVPLFKAEKEIWIIHQGREDVNRKYRLQQLYAKQNKEG